MSLRTAPMPLSQQLAESASAIERQLPSGRSLVLRTGAGGEEIEIRSPLGELDIKITLTATGPVISLRGGRLELESPTVAVRCQSFDVTATSDISLKSQGELQLHADELRAKAERDIHLNGAFVRLNCWPEATPDSGILDSGAADSGTADLGIASAAHASATDGCAVCGHSSKSQEP